MTERALLLALLWLAAVRPAAAEVLDQTGAGFTLSNTVTVAVSPQQAFDALVDAVDQWWPKDHSWWGQEGRFRIEARAGGCFCERSGQREAQHMRVIFVDPGKLLRLEGGLGPLQGMGLSGVMDWRLAATDDGGTTITLWYRAGGYTPEPLGDFVAIVDQVQAQQLGALASHLDKP
ncbi:MAG: SRPBCC family protein [Xanthomonadales bacterium]|nr:SRPBCC family protein [Xanthomonadales bacterium]MCB1640729.1 SRPBCC family protein [Xanthomonadales bacterium]